MRSACRQLTPSPKTIDSEGKKPFRITRATLDGLPEVFRKAAYVLKKRGELEII